MENILQISFLPVESPVYRSRPPAAVGGGSGTGHRYIRNKWGSLVSSSWRNVAMGSVQNTDLRWHLFLAWSGI